MRKILTASMVAGAALLVAACGGNDTNVTTTNTDLGNDTMMDANATGDMGMDTNMTMDANATDMNLTNDMNSATTADNTMATNSQ